MTLEQEIAVRDEMIKILVDALKFYADFETWKVHDNQRLIYDKDVIHGIPGRRARDAFAILGESVKKYEED
jgi:hypothetical protein